jgi:hypothetical protein
VGPVDPDVVHLVFAVAQLHDPVADSPHQAATQLRSPCWLSFR